VIEIETESVTVPTASGEAGILTSPRAAYICVKARHFDVRAAKAALRSLRFRPVSSK
jgi:hypothetical protein